MKFICPNCGFDKGKPIFPFNCRCGARIQQDGSFTIKPSTLDKMINFGSAVIQDITTGMERCTPQEIHQRLLICKECPLFEMIQDNPIRGICQHKSCGCNISTEQIYLNKLHWKSQSCPINKWPDLK